MFDTKDIHFTKNSLLNTILKLKNAAISFNEFGTPVSEDFSDVYFSNDNGLRESDYVFFQNNDLPLRWEHHVGSKFVIFETGFGTGLNFLNTWQRFLTHCEVEKLPSLHFISVEKFPLNKTQLKTALSGWPSLQHLSEQLLAQYPYTSPGCHRLIFNNGKVTLDLWLGDIEKIMPQIHSYEMGIVDAWYLDGFAPSKNPDMWSHSLFSNMTRLSKKGATVATFTAAGIVKRGLLKAGFKLTKTKGFGRKRDMLKGEFSPLLPPEKHIVDEQKKRLRGPWHRSNTSEISYGREGTVKKVAVVGAGIAGVCTSLALLEKGFSVELYDAANKPASGASGNLKGGFYPNLTADLSVQSQFYAQAFCFAHNFYNNLNEQGFGFEHEWCGVLFPAFSKAVETKVARLIENQAWPADLIHRINPQESTHIAGLELPYQSLHIPDGGWINPSSLISAMLKKAEKSQRFSLHLEHELKDISENQTIELHWENKTNTVADAVVLACGNETHKTALLSQLPIQSVRGQVDYYQGTEKLNKLRTVLCHKGYLTPSNGDLHALGATFKKLDLSREIRVSEIEENRNLLAKSLPACDWVSEFKQPTRSRASTRGSTPDHLPLMGAVPKLNSQANQYQDMYKALALHKYELPNEYSRVFTLIGLGSRGLTTAPLLAEALSCQMQGAPLPLSNDALSFLSVNRFLIRKLLRRNND